jgi:cysteine synthase A
MYVCMHVCACACTGKCLHMCIFVYVCMYVCVYACMYVHVYIYVCLCMAVMRAYGAKTVVCPAVPFSSPEHYYQRAREYAAQTPNAVWGNQFESLANMRAHVETTGPEIQQQVNGRIDAIALAAGTGGSIGGLSTYLRSKHPLMRVFLIDPPGSGLFSLVTSGGAHMTLTPGSSITEGIGISRLTANFEQSHADGAFIVTDEEVLAMLHYLLRREGLFLGPSSALNVVGAVKAARELGPGSTVVTLLCDGGDRYHSKVFNDDWLASKGLAIPAVDFSRDHADFVK